MSDLFLYAIHTADKLHGLVLGKNSLITGLFLYPVFLYPISSASISALVLSMEKLPNWIVELFFACLSSVSSYPISAVFGFVPLNMKHRGPAFNTSAIIYVTVGNLDVS